jgi:hypothetical protein
VLYDTLIVDRFLGPSVSLTPHESRDVLAAMLGSLAPAGLGVIIGSEPLRPNSGAVAYVNAVDAACLSAVGRTPMREWPMHEVLDLLRG